MRYWITREGLGELRSKETLDKDEYLVLSSLLESSSGLSVKDILPTVSKEKYQTDKYRVYEEALTDTLNSLCSQGFATTSRSKGVRLAYEASMPQTSIDYSPVGSTGSQFDIGPGYKPSEEFFLGKN